jgi:hypothetical protein
MLTKGSIYEIHSANELDSIFSFLKAFKLSEGDLKEEHELLSILLFIISLSKTSQLNFPVDIHWAESPDFTFEFRNESRVIGIEHVRATLPEYKMADRELQRRPVGTLLEPSFYSPFNRLPKGEAYKGIRNPGENLVGDGWEGNGVEAEWANIMLHALTSKVALLNEDHFRTFKENHLLIEDDSPVDFIRNLPIALKLLKSIYRSIIFDKNGILFDKVHVFSVHDFVYDVFNKCVTIDVSKKAIGSAGS